jgi:hypothetical protein
MNYKNLVLLCTVLMPICQTIAMEKGKKEKKSPPILIPQEIPTLNPASPIQMAVNNDNLYILGRIKGDDQQSLHYFDIKEDPQGILPQSGERNIYNDMKQDFESITHIATNKNGDLVFASDEKTIYFLSKDAVYDGKIKTLPKIHETKILSLYMDNNFIVSGSEAPNIRVWDIAQIFNTSEAIRQKGLKPTFEQSHAYLFYYEDGSFLYGDWRARNRIFRKFSNYERSINFVLKGPCTKSKSWFHPFACTQKAERFAQATERAKEKNTKTSLFSYPLLVNEDKFNPENTPFCTLKYPQGNTGSAIVAIYSPHSLILTLAAQNHADKSFFDIKQTITDVYEGDIMPGGLHITTHRLTPLHSIDHLIIVSPDEIKRTPIGNFDSENISELEVLEEETFKDKSIKIKASAVSGTTLFLAASKEKNRQQILVLYKIDLMPESIQPKIEKKEESDSEDSSWDEALDD